MITRTGITPENTCQSLTLVRRENGFGARRKEHLKGEVRPWSKNRCCLRDTVRIGEIGLDIENRGAVHQVGSGDCQYRAERGIFFQPFQPDTGEREAVRTIRRAGGKHPHAHIASQTGRTHSRRPLGAQVFGKLPDQPEMGIGINPAKCVHVPVFRLKDDAAFQFLHQQ